MADKLPGRGLFGWLGRQFAHVKKAVKADVVPAKKVVYRDNKVEEAEMPGQPGVKMRRTVIDEVIVERPRLERKPPTDEKR